jgi:hypothetical protein
VLLALVAVIGPLLGYIVAKRLWNDAGSIFGLVVVAALGFIVFGARMILQYRPRTRHSASTVHHYLASSDADPEFCLVLRPFGADGMFYVPTSGLVAPTRTIESLISERAARILNLPTVTVVDNRKHVVPGGPHYLRCGRDWQSDVERLMVRALFVVVVFPPGKGPTPSVRWEFDLAVRKGMLGRLLVLLPSANREARASAVLSEIMTILPGTGLDTFDPPGIVGVWVNHPPKVWYREGGSEIGASGYANILDEVIDAIGRDTRSTTYLERHPYAQRPSRRS